jgi:lipopolysaccharide/colanic/teichoic acid biosynthesis glycosyltransferase
MNIFEQRSKNSDYVEFMSSGRKFYWFSKRVFDIIVSLILLPVLIFFTLILIMFNLFFNKGSIFYRQKRMGVNCSCFIAIKFRTMTNINIIQRKFDEPVEEHRITFLGQILRKTRVDELPQILNVLKGEMSLIGPRPDYYEHALIFLDEIKEYRVRHIIRPGISGLAQIRLGYAQGIEATRNKVKVDIYYIQNANWSLDLKIFFYTIITIFKGLGI